MIKQPATRRCVFFCAAALTILALLSACGGETATQSQTRAQPRQPQTTQPAQPTRSANAWSLTSPIVYVALGASDALGVGSSEPEKQGYVPLLAQHLPQGSRTLDLGVDGILLHAALQEELPDALAAKPGLVTAWFGANDFIRGVSYDSYIQDLGTLLRRLSTETHARIAIANLPDLTLLPALDRLSAAQKTWARQQIQRWNAGTAAQARLNGAILVDLYSHNSQLTAHPEYVSADGFHPSAQGYSQLARYFWQAINKS